jgi:signal transduction histidine kinase
VKRASLRTVWFYFVLALLWLGIASWLYQEQKRQRRQDEESQRAQGRVLIQTIASSIRSQSRMAMYQPERLQAILEEVIVRPGVLALALFDEKGTTVASAGEVDRLARSPAPGTLENWKRDALQLWSPVRIGEIPWHLQPGPRGPGGPPPGMDRRGGPSRPWAPRPDWLPPRPPPESDFFLTVLLPLESLRVSSAAGTRLRVAVAGMSLLLVLAVAMGWRASVRGVALRSSLALAEEQNRYLREMNLAASGLAHETKNPLNAVRMAAQTLASATPGSPDWEGRVKLIADEVDRLDARINEWLAFSRPRQPHHGNVELGALLEEVRTLVSLDADEKKAHLQLQHNDDAVLADREMLRQLLFNLLLNAVQAIEKGGTLSVNVEKQKDGNFTIAVEDDGVGIPPEDRDKLFTPYFTTRPEGSGLGLAICRRIALAHGWRLRYEPRVPCGSSFILEGINPADSSASSSVSPTPGERL